MATNIIPEQSRAIDPFASYYSNSLNSALTKLVTANQNCLFSANTIEVTTDYNLEFDISPGICIKDNVTIEITDAFTCDISDPAFFLDSAAADEVGYYYITLRYTYIKSRPAPTASVVILKASERGSYSQDSEYLFLKCMSVTFNGVRFVIDSVLDADPDTLTNRRMYSPAFAGLDNTLPVFDRSIHEGKILYIRDEDDLYYGTSASWIVFDTSGEKITTTACDAGDIGYISPTGVVLPAIATATTTLGDCCVTAVGVINNGGRVIPNGVCVNVPVETGRTIIAGNTCYLSASEAGKVTDQHITTYVQNVGVCLEASGSTITLWFQPDSSLESIPELIYLAGVTSNIQTQLDDKVDTSGSPVATDFARFSDADTIEGRDASQVRGDIDVYSTAEAQADSIKWALVFGG